MSKEYRVSVRVSDELKVRLEKAAQQTGIDETTIVRNCIDAFCESAEQNGNVSFPLKIVPQGEVKYRIKKK